MVQYPFTGKPNADPALEAIRQSCMRSMRVAQLEARIAYLERRKATNAALLREWKARDEFIFDQFVALWEDERAAYKATKRTAIEVASVVND